MQIEILNRELISKIEPTFDISFEDITDGFKKLFEERSLEDINIVFVNSQYIQDLNKEYRDIDAPTDVLSFNISKNSGEIYICPEYVYTSFQGDEFEEEILRLIIHGTLHMLGYDHRESLNESPNEQMFVEQEELLLKYKKICSS